MNRDAVWNQSSSLRPGTLPLSHGDRGGGPRSPGTSIDPEPTTSIRSKALSSDTPPLAVRQHRCFASTVEDQDHWRTRLHHLPVKLTSFHQPSIRPTTSTMIFLCEPPAPCGRRERPINSAAGSAVTDRPGAPAGYSRCERSLDTLCWCAASSRVVPPVGARPLLWPRPSVCCGSDADTAAANFRRNAPRSGPLPPATVVKTGCLAC